jgi:rhodanese-related sulfurtransferase
MARSWSQAAAPSPGSPLATAARQALLLLAISAALTAGRWALVAPRLSLRADPVDYEIEYAAPLVDVAQARKLYDAGIHLFIDTRESGPEVTDTVPGAFVVRASAFDDDMLALIDTLVPEDKLILFGDGSLAVANNIASRLIAHGYPEVSLLKGGLGAWRAAGGPTSPRQPAVAP